MASIEHQITPSTQLDYSIEGWDDADDAFFVNISMQDARFSIYVSPENFRQSPNANEEFSRYMSLLSSDDKEEVDALWDYLDSIAAPFLPAFRQLAPAREHCGKLTLLHLFSRRYFECRLEVVGDVPLAGPIQPREHEADEADEADDSCDAQFAPASWPFPTFTLADVEVPHSDSRNVFDIIPTIVVVNQQEYFWKSSYASEMTTEEINKYGKIHASSRSTEELRTARLYAVVTSTAGRMRGLLFHPIEHEQTLTWAVDDRTPQALRQKWATQIQSTIYGLHDIGVVWGDAKAANVLIDKDGNAVIIDLEGGCTRGWVDKDKAGTVEGDVQGLQRILDFIYNDDSLLRPDQEARDDDSGERTST